MVMIPVFNTVILPDTKIYFQKNTLDAEKSENLHIHDKIIFLFRKEKDGTKTDTFYPIGVCGTITGIDENGLVSVETSERLYVENVQDINTEISGIVKPEIQDVTDEESQNHFHYMQNALLKFVQKYPWGMMARSYVLQWKTLNEIAVGMSSLLNLTNEEKYQLLETDSMSERNQLIEKAIMEFMSISDIMQEAEEAQKQTNEQIYREDAIKKQIRFLQEQLDQMHPENITDVEKFEKKIAALEMNETAKKEAETVLKRLKLEGENGHEYGMLYSYLEFITSLEWKTPDMDEIDLKKAEKILDEEHYGLKKVKKRILEHLAVMALKKEQSGSILLFVGPPGTGKTSIGRSIANALGRKYVRVSLGGIRDEAEIRGHRRTYIGAMPGRIMDGIKNSKASNPVMVLDEVDKLTTGYGGDPSSALLEVLDPEQNSTFTDHYVNAPYDLSKVFFICTANSTDNIPAPLLDRMEVIRFSGYTPDEKLQIAKRHLLSQSKEKMGISPNALKLTDGTIREIILGYTMESGVRGLKKQIDSLCRNAAVALVKGQKKHIRITERQLPNYLEDIPVRHEKKLKSTRPGIVTGLAWTALGGEILFIETISTKGKGRIKITGQLGDVMKESVEIAISLVKNLYPKQATFFEKNDIHIHVPAGSVPKDGPSAGITLTTALASLVTGKAVSPELAMTGEVSLRGNLMPIGGLPEKLMAAQRAGIQKVFIPEENTIDLKEVPKEVLGQLEVIPVKKVQDVLKQTLETEKGKKEE